MSETGAPLEQQPFVKLPVGAIQPKGWLLESMKRQKDGLCGHLGEISKWGGEDRQRLALQRR